MGFEKSQGHSTYIKVVDGKFAVKCEEGDEGAVARTLKGGPNEGDTVYEQLHDAYSGHVKKVWIKDGSYGDQLNIKVSDGKSAAIITVPVSSRHAKKLFVVMNNIDLEQPVTFSPYKLQKKVDGKTIKDKFIHGWTIKQDDEAIEGTITREDIPEMVEKKVKGKMVWDDSDQIEFFVAAFNEWKEKSFPEDDYKEDEKPSKPVSKPASKKQENDGIDLEEDEIPF